MQANLNASAAFTFQQEGGYSSDRRDAGNWSSGKAGVGTFIGSMYGISAPQLIDWCKNTPGAVTVTAAVMQALPQATADAIYGARYWQALRCNDLPAGVDLMQADMGYNAGDTTSAMLLQQQLGLAGGDVDGWIGPQTIAALATAGDNVALWASGLTAASAKSLQSTLHLAADGEVGPLTLAALAEQPAAATLVLSAALADRQAQHYRSLATFPIYGTGWLARVERRLAAALAIGSGANQ